MDSDRKWRREEARQELNPGSCVETYLVFNCSLVELREGNERAGGILPPSPLLLSVPLQLSGATDEGAVLKKREGRMKVEG